MTTPRNIDGGKRVPHHNLRPEARKTTMTMGAHLTLTQPALALS